MRAPQLLAFLLLAALLASGVGFWRYQREQSHLQTQLQQLDNVLRNENNQAAREAAGTMEGIKAEVAQNHNQALEMARFRRLELLQAHVSDLTDTLRAYADALRRATGNPAAPAPLQHPDAASAVVQLLGQGTRRQQWLRQQLAACTNTLRQLAPADTAALPQVLAFDNVPVVEALATLTQLENDVCTCQTSLLRQAAKRFGASLMVTHLTAAATAESNVVAPGDTYRAELLLVSNFSSELRMQMACNGRPVPVGTDGVGLVRFRAPTRPGPATWMGTVRINQNGRDTTFQVQVPYRVVRR